MQGTCIQDIIEKLKSLIKYRQAARIKQWEKKRKKKKSTDVLPQEGTQRVDKYVRSCLTSLTVTVMQIAMTIRFCFTWNRLPKIKTVNYIWIQFLGHSLIKTAC